LGLFGIILTDAFWFERYIIQWTSFDLSEGEKERVKVIQLTDLHMKSLSSFHIAIAQRINNEKPDLLFFTGDSINNNRGLTFLKQFLERIDRAIPKVVIMGNVEYSGRVNITAFSNLFKNYNGTLLINENLVFQIKDRPVCIIGTDDFVGGNPDFRRAVQAVDTAATCIVLNHCPVYSNEIARLSQQLQIKTKVVLSGHTHGGQITILGKAFFKPFGSGDFLRGWYRVIDSKIYVSKGIGTRYLPIRLGSRAEATIFYV
jgi:predicted MPP superfamily phosphohydrolase